MLIMRLGFNEQKFSLAIAESIMLSIVIIIVSVLQIQYINRKKVYQ